MIISKTPLRMSFVGGGSDLANYYRKYGGAVVSVAIDKYVYVTVNKKFDNKIRISYSKTEEVTSVEEIEHKLVRECMRKLNLPGGIEITTIADIPSRGTGLGSSSCFTVGLLHALHAYQHRYVSANHLGAESCHIEIDICGEPIGKQDQYASAFGGFNFITFNPDDTVDVVPIICKRETMTSLQDNIIVFYTGMVRSASGLLQKQSIAMQDDKDKQKTMQRMVELAYTLRDSLHKDNIHDFGEILHENWLLKKNVNNDVSTSEIDDWYNKGIKAGAIGGKILGAGAGGFLMFYAPREHHEAIAKALPELRQMETKFERQGS
ncbi:GHMP kinase, partial [Gammaproteobacteria bacterium SCGC AG-212-F23]